MKQFKLWQYEEIPEDKAEKLAEEAGISRLLARIFLSRGMEDPAAIKDFLEPCLDKLHDPFLLPDMHKAVERICEALDKNEHIIIYGDYDVDGITSTTILTDFLRSLGAHAGYYIPDRLDEGYGLSAGAIDKVKDMGASLIVTVDCGVTAIDEVEYIKASGMEVIVTDHHECKDELPRALAVVCPSRLDSQYPFRELAGVGVAFKLIHALCIRLGLDGRHMKYLELVCLGTVADVVPLIDENRMIVKHGLQRLENTSNIGLNTLIEFSGLSNKPLTSWSISFGLAPRINAAGRVGSASRAIQLFLTDDKNEALGIAAQLQEANRLRQEMEMEILREAEALIEQQTDLEKEKVIVVAGDGWHHGVVGIVASKLTEKYYRPCILISCEDGMGKGSGRSIEGFDLFRALCFCGELLERFGGHEMAAGVTLKEENIDKFRWMINDYADRELDPEWLVPRLSIDAVIDGDDIDIDGVRELEKLAPFGAGNPGPLIECDSMRVLDIRTVGNNKQHLKLRLEREGKQVDAIGFNLGSLAGEYGRNDLLDVACALEINTWNSIESVQLNLKDLRPNEGDADLQGYISSGKKTLVLVNSPDSLKRLDSCMQKFNSSVKNNYSICYTVPDGTDHSRISVIVNPDPERLETSGFEQIIIYGAWICDQYFDRLLEALKDRPLILCSDGKDCFDLDAIIPERRDLAAVYKFVRALGGEKVPAGNPSGLAKGIMSRYGLDINGFKVAKCIQIFEDLGLMKRETAEDGCLLLSITGGGGEKADIGKSHTYKRLQALKLPRSAGH